MKTFGTSIAIALAALLGLAASWSPARAQGTLVNGARGTGLISPVGDMDTWTFSADSGAAIVVRVGEAVAGSPLTPNVTLYGPDMSPARDQLDAQSEAEVVKTAPSSRTYTVVVGDRYSGSGGYQITMVKTGSPVEGGPLTNGAKYTGTIEIGDLDAWTVDATAGDAIVVRMGKGVRHREHAGPGGADLQPRGGTSSLTAHQGLEGLPARSPFTRSASGPYLVLASDWLTVNIGGSGGYDLTMVKTGSPVTTSPGDEGGPLVNGATYLGTLEYGDLDAWTVDAAKGEEIIVRSGEVVAEARWRRGCGSLAPGGRARPLICLFRQRSRDPGARLGPIRRDRGRRDAGTQRFGKLSRDDGEDRLAGHHRAERRPARERRQVFGEDRHRRPRRVDGGRDEATTRSSCASAGPKPRVRLSRMVWIYGPAGERSRPRRTDGCRRGQYSRAPVGPISRDRERLGDGQHRHLRRLPSDDGEDPLAGHHLTG